jgi:hypothetical protein
MMIEEVRKDVRKAPENVTDGAEAIVERVEGDLDLGVEVRDHTEEEAEVLSEGLAMTVTDLEDQGACLTICICQYILQLMCST